MCSVLNFASQSSFALVKLGLALLGKIGMNLNKTFVLGRLTQDPNRRNLPSGNPVVSFGVATNRYYTTQDGQKQEEVEFHNIVIFGKLAETAAQYLRKGSMVLIEGRLKTRNWQDASGVRHYKTEVIAERMQLGPRAASTQVASSFQPAPPPRTQIKKAVSDEEIPVIEEDSSSTEGETKEEPNNESGNNPDNNSNNPQGRPKQNLTEDNEKEEIIDVKDIPF